MQPYLVLDACVLMSGILRPWLLALSKQGLFYPLWSEKIGDEWRRNAARLWSISEHTLQVEWQTMNEQFTDANISTTVQSQRYPPPALAYSDPKDWHVITTAYFAKRLDPQRQVGVLTLNLKDFRRSELRSLDLELWEPDRLLTSWWTRSADTLTRELVATIDDLVRSGRRQPAPIEDFLRRERLFKFRKIYTQQVT